jgi:predicted nucleotidyltransferase component of viral defense system
MPNVTQLIRSVAREKQVQQYIVEKDYALSYLLAAINATERLSESLVLKGGTALRKLYFADYRFSEDLDYSTRLMGPIEELDALMDSVVRLMGEMLNQRGPFQVTAEKLTLREPHPGAQAAYTIRVQFPGQRQPLCHLKVEITVDEPILLPVENRLLLHGFAEDLDITIPVYALGEITAEKLRALLQSRARLQDKGWGASRVCRDYYDLWNLLQLPGVRASGLIPVLDQKCAVRCVSYGSPQDFIAEELFAVARKEWSNQLLPFIPNAPAVSEFLPQVKALILSIWETSSLFV